MISQPAQPPLLARAAELSALTDAYGHAVAAGPVTVLIGGEAGIGKSRLVSEFTAGLPARTLLGGCLALGADALPYAPFVALLRNLVREFGVEWAAGLLPGGGRRGLAHWLPELGEPTAVPDSYGRARLFEEVLTLIEAAAGEQPLAIAVEDLHWADASSRELLLFLVRNLSRPGVLLLGTYRSTDLDEGHPLRSLLTSLSRLDRVRRVDPKPLQRSDVAEWLTARRRDPARADEIHRRSQGNPLFVEALAESEGPATPTPLRDLLLSGLRELPDQGRRMVRAASAADGAVGHPLLATVTGLDELLLEDLLRPAVERRLLVPVGDGYTFRHALIRAAVYEDLLPGERARLHARYARALAADPALAPAGQVSAALAAHWHAAGDHPQALEAAWRAAAVARDGHAYAEQFRLLERVLELWAPDAAPGIGVGRDAVLRAAARAALDAGEAERGIVLATAALAETREPERAALLLEVRSLLEHRSGRDGLDDLREAVRLVPAAATAVHGRLLATLASRLCVLSRDREALDHAEVALQLGRAADDPGVQALALATLAALASRAGDPASARAHCEEATRLATEAGDDDTVVLAAVVDSLALKAAGAYAEATTVARNGLDSARRVGLAGSRGAVLAAVLADSLFCLGRWREARETVQDALAQDPPALYQAVLLTNLGALSLAEGDTAAAAKAAADADRLIAPDYTGLEFLLPLRDLQCQTALANGDHEEAGRLLGRLLADPELGHQPTLAWPLIHTGLRIAEVQRARGAGDKQLRSVAEELLTRLGEIGDRLGTTGPVQEAQRASFRACIGGDRADHGTALAAWRALGHPYPLAEALLKAAEAELRSGARPVAEAYLREAGATASVLGATPLRREAELLAARGRVSLDTPELDRPDGLGLTPRETEVLRLVAEGHSNRRIAEDLFISAKTAGVHVSNILAKLAVTSRTEAAALAHRLRLFE
ncbi:AAA family ATPase [Kitasatospora sp. NPDC056138]|uniref:helix-turn-helix transcriptional regulator n=1 Tax=Kitasatospora sp. NPDC056138 TaxID=3345724 RepID=UPI0035D83997